MSLKVKLWNDEGYVKTIEDKLGYNYKDLNKNEVRRITTATVIAAISRGNDESKNPTKRFNHLLKEASDDIKIRHLLNMDSKIDKKAGRPLEYIPVKIYSSFNIAGNSLRVNLYTNADSNKFTTIAMDKYNRLLKHSYVEYERSIDRYIIKTNMRNLYNLNIEVPYTENLGKEYFICEVKAPYFVFAQLRTHGQLSQVAVSERVVKENEVWLPEDILNRLVEQRDKVEAFIKDLNIANHLYSRLGRETLSTFMIEDMSINEAQSFLKILGYKKEVYDRWYNHMKYKTWIIGGWVNDPEAWGHFLLEREAFPNISNSWVQETTKETVQAIKELLVNWLRG